MASIKGTKLYMILYNYADCDYAVIKIMENMVDAYNYICAQLCDDVVNIPLNNFKVISVASPDNLLSIIDEKIKKHEDNTKLICYIPVGNYHKYELSDYDIVSPYIIIPMTIE